MAIYWSISMIATSWTESEESNSPSHSRGMA